MKKLLLPILALALTSFVFAGENCGSCKSQKAAEAKPGCGCKATNAEECVKHCGEKCTKGCASSEKKG